MHQGRGEANRGFGGSDCDLDKIEIGLQIWPGVDASGDSQQVTAVACGVESTV